jgi:hypothetical protein
MVVVYLAESVLWPFVNERRAILVLPILLAWYVSGGAWLWRSVRRLVSAPSSLARLRAAGIAVATLAVAVPLLAQMPRDYLYGWGQEGSHFGGSRYAAVLQHLGRPADVVETDYRSSTALFTGHATNWSVFTGTMARTCFTPAVLSAFQSDHAGFLLVGDLNKPGVLDSPCLQSTAPVADWAVQILHTSRDDASVYELIGPETGHPDLVDLLKPAGPPSDSSLGSVTTVTWTLSKPEEVSQLSVGEASAEGGPTKAVRLEVASPNGTWTTVTESAAAVGDGTGSAPYLVRGYATPQLVSGIRVVVDGTSPATGAMVTDVAALGPGSGSS